ncbi:hypothetical protein LVJ94_01945 [Pendulispora rubella]|uniref:Uncharacterized protein n=1 Tax=Pendulispora rubella TaxID=2741070 RepID=A0ABZ2L9Y7_9BACT
MKLRSVTCLAFCITMVACASESNVDPAAASEQGAKQRAASPPTMAARRDRLNGGACNAGTRLTPTNLAADTCDTAGERDLIVPAGSWETLDATTDCPARVSQGEGLPDICVYKFANVSILGRLTVRQFQSPVAIVATGSLTVDGTIESGPIPGDSACTFAGGRGGTNATGTTGTPLLLGTYGSRGCPGGTPPQSAAGGRGGMALQLTSCGDLHFNGTIDVSGESGEFGANGNLAFGSAGDGAGGGAGGAILLEAKTIATGQDARTTALGGWGGSGGDGYQGTPPWAESYPGGAGGAPGQPGACASQAGCGGDGGGAGNVIVKVPAGIPAPSLTSNPPATFGTVGTH